MINPNFETRYNFREIKKAVIVYAEKRISVYTLCSAIAAVAIHNGNSTVHINGYNKDGDMNIDGYGITLREIIQGLQDIHIPSDRILEILVELEVVNASKD